MDVKDLKPELIWHYFDEITKVPRPSKKEGKIRAFLLDFAREHHLDAKEYLKLRLKDLNRLLE